MPAFTPPPLPSDDKRWKIVNGTMVGDIGRTMIPYLKAGNYDGAVTLAE